LRKQSWNVSWAILSSFPPTKAKTPKGARAGAILRVNELTLC
jgi:hypothetical protein